MVATNALSTDVVTKTIPLEGCSTESLPVAFRFNPLLVSSTKNVVSFSYYAKSVISDLDPN